MLATGRETGSSYSGPAWRTTTSPMGERRAFGNYPGGPGAPTARPGSMEGKPISFPSPPGAVHSRTTRLPTVCSMKLSTLCIEELLRTVFLSELQS